MCVCVCVCERELHFIWLMLYGSYLIAVSLFYGMLNVIGVAEGKIIYRDNEVSLSIVLFCIYSDVLHGS